MNMATLSQTTVISGRIGFTGYYRPSLWKSAHERAGNLLVKIRRQLYY
jgi:hypothetical protein